MSRARSSISSSGRRGGATLLTLAALAVVSTLLGDIGCGYQPAYGGTRPEGRLTVVAAPSRAPEGGALSAILAGLRGELSRAGVLTSGAEYPRVVVELVRVDERGIGQAQTALAAAANGGALARGTLVGVTARAWVEEKPNSAMRDTGDIRRTVSFGVESSTSADLTTREVALEAAGRATGAALGRRVLGEVEVTQEPM